MDIESTCTGITKTKSKYFWSSIIIACTSTSEHLSIVCTVTCHKGSKKQFKAICAAIFVWEIFFLSQNCYLLSMPEKKISNFFYSDFLQETILRGSDWCKLTLIFCKKFDIFCNNTYFLLQKSFLIYTCNSMLVFSIINHISLSYTIMQN